MMNKIIPCLMALFVSNNSNAELVNGGFENFPVENNNAEVFADTQYDGWRALDTTLEIWGNMYRGIPSYEGGNFLMLKPTEGVYQDVPTILENLDWFFAYRPRAGQDILNFQIIDFGIDSILGTPDDSVLVNQSFTQQIPKWYESTGTFYSLGNPIRISFTAIQNTSGNNGNNEIGNYVDKIIINSSYIPGPGTISLLFLSGIFTRFRRR